LGLEEPKPRGENKKAGGKPPCLRSNRTEEGRVGRSFNPLKRRGVSIQYLSLNVEGASGGGALKRKRDSETSRTYIKLARVN